MRFNQGHAEVTTEGFAASRAGSIKASGKAFKGLIDGLYSRKIEAIVRELSTNAFDAHKLVGSIAPFETHLPSALDPVFWIRDFGPGMSNDFMLERYPVLFDSTKDGLNADDGDVDPNDQVGCLGLGRMSFFSYTDACTVSVYQDGEQRVYAVYMGGDGVIQIALAGAVDTDEPNGVKVEFAVKVKDFNQFKEAATRVYKGFPVVPKGLPSDVAAAIHVEPNMIGKFWKSYGPDYLPGAGFYARQGCVLYPIDLQQVDGKAVEDDDGEVTLSSNFAAFAKNPNTVVIDFPIGSIGFDLSRERLSYDDDTVAELRKRWEAFREDLNSQFKAQFSSLRNAHERMRAATSGAVKQFGALFGCSKEAIEAECIKGAIWSGFPRTSNVASVGVSTIQHILKKPKMGETPTAYRYSQQWGAPSESDMADSHFVYMDEKKPHEKARIGRWMQANDIPFAIILRRGKLTLKSYREWGEPPITRMSDIPAIPKEARPSSGGGGGGGGGVFDRFKFPDDICYGLNEATSDADAFDMDDRYFALINKGEFITDNKKLEWMDTCDVQLLHRIVKRTQGINITFINTRINEPDDKWDAYPKFDHLLDDLVEKMHPVFIRRFITVLNRTRFVESRYCSILNRWKAGVERGDDPISRLARFEKRYVDMTHRDRSLAIQLMSACGIGITYDHKPGRPFWNEFLNQIIERARGMGLEVLPDMGNRGRVNSICRHRLLPKKWESIAIIVGDIHNNHDLFCKLLLKETTSC